MDAFVKTGDIRVGRTPDIEKRLSPGQKQADDKGAQRKLDNDPQKRAADAVADRLKK